MCIIAQRWPGAQALPSAPVIAVDSEFHHATTLTVQTAMRIDSQTLALQVYRSASIPGLPGSFDQNQYLPMSSENYGRFCSQILLRPVKLLTSDLSPGRMMCDLLDRNDIMVSSRAAGIEQLEAFDAAGHRPSNVSSDKPNYRWHVPSVDLTLVGHFLRADFYRVFGHKLLDDLLNPHRTDYGKVKARCRKVVEFVETLGRRTRTDPTLEYVSQGDHFFELRVRMRDTFFPFGPASLNVHSYTFLGLGKSDVLSPDEKKDMVATFTNRTAEAYGYALVDPINTLLIYEQMQRKDEAIYAAFGFNLDGIPPLRPTLGSRVSTFIVSTVRKTIQSRALASGRALEGLMQKGGVALFKAHSDASKFGVQTGTTHGGLLFSRSPTKFWHESVGMLRDVDMAGCYNNVIARLNIYWGRPVIYEPGQERWTLRQAVEFVKEHVDTDAWFIRVTGDIRAFPNALIPSTEAAITSENYREKLRTGKRRRQRQRVFHLEALRDPASVKGTRGSKLYAARVESGIVTAKTWLMISALPANWRKEYEELTVDSIIFYPTALVAGDGQQFDEISQRHESIDLPWAASLNMSGMEVVRREKIGTDYIALRYPIGQYAEKIGQYRKKAQEADGKGSGADVAWKVHANSMYGVLASSHLPTNNFVGANQVTAWARAEAFALSQALNAVQTITDGCTYRLDQIPACTYAECLRIKPDYPIRRAEAGDGIPFADPATIPADDNGFTIWYRQHVKTFFEIEGSEYEELFATHNLEHKKTSVTKSVAFDGLACDGAGNYAKCVRDGNGGWTVEDLATRSYGRESKAALKDWMVKTYSTDHLVELAPITEDKELLSFSKAGQKASKAIKDGAPDVYFPLGFENRKVLAYRVIKASAFIFRTPQQRAAILKQIQKFEERKGAGLEQLCLRRSYGGRRHGSLVDLAEAIYHLIGSDEAKLVTKLNLYKTNKSLDSLCENRLQDIRNRKQVAWHELRDRMDMRKLDHDLIVTGYVPNYKDIHYANLLE